MKLSATWAWCQNVGKRRSFIGRTLFWQDCDMTLKQPKLKHIWQLVQERKCTCILLKVGPQSLYHVYQLFNVLKLLSRCCFLLTESLHGLDQFQGERLVFGQVFKHACDLVVPRPDDILPINALYMVANTDHLHIVRNAAVFDTLPHTESTEKRKQRWCNYRMA